jgi:short-subunit dehydrogenase
MGARVAICARDSEELSLALDDLRRCTGCEALAIPCDVTDREEAEAMVKSVEERLGPIDILINNAGMIAVGPMESMTEGDYAEALALHFWAPFNTIHAVLPSMKARRFGRIVNVASIGGKVAIPHLLPYSTSKHALVGFSQGLRAELVKDGIHVTTVCPGTVRTGSPRNALFKGQNEKEYAWFKLSDSLPGISQSAESCAAEIIGAVLHGDADLVTSLPAKLMAMVNGVLPGFVADAMGVVNGTLPEPGGVGTGERFGYESETELSNSRLTVLTRRAEEDNNQLAAGPNTAAPVPSPL